MSEVVIKFDHVSKEYRLGTIGGGTLKGDLQSFMARIRGKEDPNSMIGTKTVTGNERFLALDDISFEVHKGEALGIIGHNGAGKSTLLKLLSRVTAPSAGTISYDGRIASMLEVGTGFHPELTGRENVYMNGAILGMTRAEIDRKFDEIVAFAEMEKFIDTPVKRYSSGMYVKLAFSVAAHLDSEIMVMDEVLAVGDMKFQQKCLGRMGDAANSEGRTVLYVSHNMNTIRQLCSRCIVLSHGKIVFDGGVEEAISVYMNQAEDRRVSYDYSDLSRSPNESRNLQMLSCDIRNRAENCVAIGDQLEFTLYLLANRDVEDVGLRFEIFYQDDTVAGTVFLNKTLSAKKGQKLDVTIALSTNNFAPGRYKAIALLFERDRYGNQIGVDRVDPALSFETYYENKDELVWLHQYWGHVCFDNMMVKNIEVR